MGAARTSSAASRPSTIAVTLFAGEGVRGVVDQLSRTPESLARSFARVPAHGRAPEERRSCGTRVLVVSPEHARVFREAGWSKARLREELDGLLQTPGRGDRARRGRHRRGHARGVLRAGTTLPKFRDGGLLIVHAGGGAGLFSAIIGGWASGAVGSEPVTQGGDGT